MNHESPWQSATSYVVITAAVSWILWTAGALLLPELLLVFVLVGAWVPTIVALGLTNRDRGRDGVRRLLRRLVHWRVGLRWYGVAIFAIPAIVGLAAGIHLLLGGTVPSPSFPADLPGNQEYLLLPVIFLVNIVAGGPLAEEIGWRGYLQPLLNQPVGVLPAGLGVGLVWGLWHLPFFFLPGGETIVGGLSLVWYVPLVTGWSVIFGWVVTRTGSILLAVLLHASMNTTLGTLGLLNGPLRVRALTLAVTAAVVVALFAVSRRSPTSAEASHAG